MSRVLFNVQNVQIEVEQDCICSVTGSNGTRKHTTGPWSLFSQRTRQGARLIVSCPNHKAAYEASKSNFRLMKATQVESPIFERPLLRTVYVHSKLTHKVRTLVVRRAVSGQPVWYVLSDSGNEYMVQNRRTIWLCECKHFIARAFSRGETCHHIEGVRQADPEALYIEKGGEPKKRYQ